MTTLFVTITTRPRYLHWWQWGKISGLFLPAALLLLGIDHPLLWALATHAFVDFTAQSSETATGKAQGNWRILVYHAFIAGGYPGLIAGGLPGLLVSGGAHLLVDKTNKFGLDEPIGPILDQLAHMMTLLAIWWIL